MTLARTLVASTAAALLLVGTACGGGSDTTNNSNQNAADAGPDVTVTCVGDAGTADDAASSSADAGTTDAGAPLPSGWQYKSEYQLRVNQFQFDHGSPAFGLNTLLKTNLEDQSKKYPVVVLIDLKNIDTDAGTLSIRGGAGVKANLDCDPSTDGPCDYKWDPATPQDYTEGSKLDSATGHLDAKLDSLLFIASFEVHGEVQKAEIPITNLTLTGDLVPEEAGSDTVMLANGHLEGTLTKEAADSSQIQLVPGQDPVKLSRLLGEASMNIDRDCDGTPDAWHLTATLEAHEASVVQ